MWEQEFLDELVAYLGFTAEHARVLAASQPYIAPSVPEIVERFYRAIAENPRTIAVFTGGTAQIERQKGLLTDWFGGLLGGVYDIDYVRKRARIGRTHVRIKLDQRYMFAAMNLVREGLHDALHRSAFDPARRLLAHRAIDKICDLELAIMLQTYSEAYVLRMRDVERLATLGQLSGFIGHELRNPLAVMETSLHLLRKRIPLDDAHAQRHLQRLTEQLSISGEIISDLLELARDRDVVRSEVDLARVLRETVARVPEARTVEVAIEVPDDLPKAWLDRSQIQRLVSNLVTNGCHAVADRSGARVEVLAARDGDGLVLVVQDNGEGISEEVRPRLFESLTTTRPKGLGLGLALCRRIVEKHDGIIRAENRPEGGARFEVRFPRSFEERS